MRVIAHLLVLVSAGLLGGVVALGEDSNGDGHIDLRDYGGLQACFTGPGGGPLGAECDAFDIDGDQDVDGLDHDIFQMEFTGPVESVPVDQPQSGAPRRWEAGMGVGTGASVNLRNGNLLTVIPILSWSGRGPALSVGLFHNSAGVGKLLSFEAGVYLRPGWSISYSGYVGESADEATVVDDDSTHTTYRLIEDQYVPPAGVYTRLEKIDGVGWQLTYKDQTRREYDTAGRLVKEVDASGNELLIGRGPGGRIEQIEDAGGRLVTFAYDGNGRLQTIHDPGVHRSWTLVHEAGSGRLSEIRSPLYEASHPNRHVWKFQYDEAGRITSLADKAGDAFTYQYGSTGRLLRVYDPGELGDQFQQFRYTDFTGGGPEEHYQKTCYTDRRGSVWTSWFNESDDLYQYANPLGDQVELACNANHQVQRYTDPMGRYWDYTYDDQGNLTDVMDQYGRGSHWAHDELNNLTSYTDAVGHVWTMQYNDANNPTSVTDVYAPATGLRDEPAHTQFQYYGSVEPTWNGMLDRVIDPIGVATHFEYDEYGQLALYTEGNGALELLYRYNTAGWLRNVWNEEDVGFNCSPVTAMCSRDAEGNITGCGCPHYWCKDGEPERWNDQPFGMFEAELDGMGRLVSMNNDVYYNPDNWQQWQSREVDVTYDALGRPQMRIESSTESGVEVERAFDFIPDDKLGIYTVGGPDGALTVVTLDQAGRTAMVEQEGTWAEYTYHPDGRVDTISRSNGTATTYTHDFESLSMGIEHYDGDGALMLGLEYVFTTNGLVSSIAESGDSGQVAITTFEHDARGRLTREERVGSEPYLATYRYDANGNRLEDSLRVGELESPTVQTCYVYYSNHNRIHGYRKWISSELIEEGGYTYDDYENIRSFDRLVCDGGEEWYYWTDLKYDKMGRVWRVLESERPPGGSVESVAAREFRYAGARQRYLTRQLDPSTLDPIPGSDVWSDYLGDLIYGDYTVAGSTATMTRRYVPGEWQTDVQAAATSFFHTNMLGTTRMLSDNLGTAIPDTNRLYTAYGVPIAGPTSPTTRYGYAGAWGYQEHDDLSILHVGARYYDPSIGRFLQRDPIGIMGGLNVYAYVGNDPLNSVDPTGLVGDIYDFHDMRDDPWGTYGHKPSQEFKRGFNQGTRFSLIPFSALYGGPFVLPYLPGAVALADTALTCSIGVAGFSMWQAYGWLAPRLQPYWPHAKKAGKFLIQGMGLKFICDTLKESIEELL